MAVLQTLDELKNWEEYRVFMRKYLRMMSSEAEPFYVSPSVNARSVSAGDVARRLQTLYDDISAGVSKSKTSVSEVITDWKSEIEGYESAVRARRIPMFMGEAVRFATWQQALRQ